MEFHCLDRERASADLSSLDAVEVSAVDIIHDSPSIVDQWHVCILLDYPYGLSVTLHDGIRFLPPPTPAVPSLPLARSVPLSGRTSGFPCSIRKTFSFGSGAVFRPKGHRPFDDGTRYFHHPTQVPFWSVRSPFRVRFVFARCQVTALTTIHSTFTMPNTP